MIHFIGIDVEVPSQLGPFNKRWIDSIVHRFGKKTGEVFFLFCSDNYLLDMNQTYLAHDTFTDIITFDLSESDDFLSGELYISLDRVIENAEYQNISFIDELNRVMIHGVLHMLGFNDKTVEEQIEMRKQEDICLSLRT